MAEMGLVIATHQSQVQRHPDAGFLGRLKQTVGKQVIHRKNPAWTGQGSQQFQLHSAQLLPDRYILTMAGGDPDVMSFPACSKREEYLLTHGILPNGAFGDAQALVSNYTLIYDVYYPAASNATWRALFQTNTGNSDNGGFFVDDSARKAFQQGAAGVDTLGLPGAPIPEPSGLLSAGGAGLGLLRRRRA